MLIYPYWVRRDILNSSGNTLDSTVEYYLFPEIFLFLLGKPWIVIFSNSYVPLYLVVSC